MTRILTLLSLLCLMTPAAATAQQASQLLNGFRTENGQPKVANSPELEAAAKAHALDMARHSFFSHEGTDGSDVGRRVTRQGFRWCVVAENIAKGQASLSEVMGAWANSAPHRRNMLLSDITAYGLVRASGNIWVMVLASDRC